MGIKFTQLRYHLFIIPVLSLIEHVLCPLLVKRAAHAAVGGEHGEDTRAAQWPSFPRTPLQHS